MNAYLKIAVGALMVALGAFSTLTFIQDVYTLARAAVGPLLLLVGAFIVWLESDELKMERKKKEEESSEGLKREFQPQEETEMDTPDQAPVEETDEDDSAMDYNEMLEGTIEEVKDRISDMDNPTEKDYRKLLEKEQQNKDRKTLKEYLKRRID